MEKLLSSQKNRIAQILFYIAFVMEVLIMCINNAGIDITIRTRLLQLAALIFGIKIILTHYSKKEWLMIVGCGVLGVIYYLSVESTLIIEIVLMIIASKDVDKKHILKLYFWIMFVSVILMIILSGVGVIGNLSLTKDYRGNGLETRYCFGYSHPNVFYSNLLKMAMSGFLVYYKKIFGWHYLLFTAINIILFLFADSRTGFLIVQLLIVSFYCLYKAPRIFDSLLSYYGGISMIAVLVLLSYLLPCLLYEKMQWLDRFLTGRIMCAFRWNWENEWSFFPQDLNVDYALDMGYFNVMANWGILIGIVYLVVVFCNYRFFNKQKNWPYVIVLGIYSIFTFVEAHAFSMYFVGNVMFLLMLGWGTYESNKPKK